jgi:hypothetical protein
LSGWMMTGRVTAMTAVFSRVTAGAVNEKAFLKMTILKKPINMRVFISMIIHMYSRMKERRAHTRRLPVTTGVPVFSTLLSLKTGMSWIAIEIVKYHQIFAC